MTTELSPQRESVVTRAETVSRRMMLVIGAGIFAWGAGSLIRAEVVGWLAQAVRSTDVSTPLAIVVHWVLARLWVLSGLTPVSYLAGRFVDIEPIRFVVVAGVAGEALGIAIDAAMDGNPFETVSYLGAWTGSFALALLFPWWAFRAGQRAHAKATANPRSLGPRPDYEAFAARAEKSNEGGADQPLDVKTPPVATHDSGSSPSSADSASSTPKGGA